MGMRQIMLHPHISFLKAANRQKQTSLHVGGWQKIMMFNR